MPPLRMLDWRERKKDGPIRNKCERIVIFKRLFDPKEFEVGILTHTVAGALRPIHLSACVSKFCKLYTVEVYTQCRH